MPLRLKAQVSATQEEEGGIKSWSLEEPSTATRLRIYEDEFKMTAALDGTRSLAEAVQYLRHQGVVVGEAELTRFFRELVIMGLAEDTDAVGANTRTRPELAPELESITRVTPLFEGGLNASATERIERVEEALPRQPREDAPLDPMTVLLGLSGPMEGQDAVLSPSDAEQLKQEALASLKRGEIAHARDHLLVLFEALPKMPHVREALGLLETVGERPASEELAGLVHQLSRWFGPSPAGARPVANIIRPQAFGLEGSRTVETKRVSAVAPRSRFASQHGLGLVVLACALFGLVTYFFVDLSQFLGPAAQAVTVMPVERRRLPELSSLTAVSVGPAEQVVLRAPSGGEVTCALMQGVRAHLSQVVARVRASFAQRASRSLPQETREDARTREKLARKVVQLEALAARFEEARKQGVPSRLTPRDRARHLARARKVAQDLVEARTAQRTFDASRPVEAPRDPSDALIRASYDGEVIQSRRQGDRVRQGDAVVTLARHGHVRVRYNGSLSGYHPGSEVELVVSGGSPVTGRFLPVPGMREDKGFEIEIPDAAGALLHVAPKQFRIVTGYAADVIEVPRAALVRASTDAKNVSILHVVDGRLVRVRVSEVDAVAASDTSVTVMGRDRSLPATLKLVTGAANLRNLNQLQERVRVRQAGD